jgi:hypothetical protein
VISLRKLAALEVFFLGPMFILAEYACGVLLSIALGAFVLYRSRSFPQILLGIYLICLGVNYMPLLFYAVSVRDRLQAARAIEDELANTRKSMSRYRTQSLILLLPLAVPVLALMQEGRRSQR